ncbi:hypothetical protein [Nocardia sp. NPDC047038]
MNRPRLAWVFGPLRTALTTTKSSPAQGLSDRVLLGSGVEFGPKS